MMNFVKIVFITLLLGLSASGFSTTQSQGSIAETEKQTIEVVINGDKFQIQSTRVNTRVDVFSIIGAKVASFEVKSGYGEANVNLPKGYYIVKTSDTSRKIAVK